MGQPVKLSDELVDDARAVVPFFQRSIAGQIEFRAGLGKSIEPVLRGDQALSLQMAGGERPLSQLLLEDETAKGRKRLPFEFLDKRPIVIALAGQNGVGKSTFFEYFLADSGQCPTLHAR